MVQPNGCQNVRLGLVVNMRLHAWPLRTEECAGLVVLDV